MKIEKFDDYEIKDLHPFEKNPKKHNAKQIQHIAESLKRFDAVQPIVVDENKVIIIGHGRFEAAKVLKMLRFPVWIVSGMDDNQKNALRIADNSTNAETGFDLELIAEAMEGFVKTNFDISDLGFEYFDIDKHASESGSIA